MTQEQYVTIIKCIQHGAAAMSDELINALNAIITTCKTYEQEKKNEQEKEKVQETKETK